MLIVLARSLEHLDSGEIYASYNEADRVGW
jgi:hypothetical protein